MKKFALILLISLLFPVIVSAQNQGREKLEAYRIGFFTRKLSLNATEAEKFWPAYNDYQKQRNHLLIERRKIIRDFNQNVNTMTDSELTDAGDKLIKTFSEESDIAEEFHRKLKETLPPAKVIMYYQAENQWRAQLLNQLQENRTGPRTSPDRTDIDF